MNFLKGAFSGAIQGGDGQPAKLNNFPVCCPFLYHNIIGECGTKIYLAMMNVVEYFVFMTLIVANLIGAIAAIAVAGASNFLGLLIMSICFIFFVPLSAFALQYWIGYSACAHQSSIRYLLFFISYFIGILFNLLMVIGVPDAGGCGLISGIKLVTTSNCTSCKGVGIYFFILATIWLLNAIYMGIMILLMLRHFRQDNGSLSNIKDSITGFFARKGVEGAIGM
jgi:hypothetical protein